MLRPGGTLVYSVCTLTAAETAGIDNWLASAYPRLRPVAPPGSPWEPAGRGARLLPQAAGTDGMYVLGVRTPG
jgi:16S rRNA (cytosine967-C5)-methyltransferase